jgi:hypothetical protein
VLGDDLAQVRAVRFHVLGADAVNLHQLAVVTIDKVALLSST